MIKEYTLGDCVKAIIDYRGKTPQKMGGDWTDKGYRVISALNVHGGFIDNEDQIRCVSPELYKKWMKDEIKRNDCFLASEGASLGENTIWDSDEKVVLGQRLYAIRTNPDMLDPWYFAMYMQTKKFRQQIDQMSTGSTVFGISQPVLSSIKLLLPSIVEQRKIGTLYRNIYHKLKNNNFICSTLESMATLLYDYWFVQFDFPNENGKPYKSSGGKMILNDKLKQKIPADWCVGNVSDLGTVVTGGTPSTRCADNFCPRNSGHAWATPKDLSLLSGRFFFHGETDITDLGLSNCSGTVMPKGSILFTTRAPIGYVAVTANEACTNQGFKSIVPFHNYGVEFVYQTMKKLIPQMQRVGVGSTFKEVSKDVFSQQLVILPDHKTAAAYNALTINIANELQILQEEYDELIQLRNFLLPLLVNGQVTVKEVSSISNVNG